MNMWLILLLLLIFGMMVHRNLSPRIVCTRTRDVLLWYTWKNSRHYIKLFTI